jgi:hypothetical protein
MGQLIGTAFGTGTPAIYPTAQSPFGGFSPFAGQGVGYGGQGFGTANPFIGGSYGFAPYGTATQTWSPFQQIAQVLQIVPQQLHQVQQLQQQQIQYLHQLLQWLPTQVQQLQQLVQLLPYQLQQQGQPFGAGISGPSAFGLSPQSLAVQGAGQVM